MHKQRRWRDYYYVTDWLFSHDQVDHVFTFMFTEFSSFNIHHRCRLYFTSLWSLRLLRITRTSIVYAFRHWWLDIVMQDAFHIICVYDAGTERQKMHAHSDDGFKYVYITICSCMMVPYISGCIVYYDFQNPEV